MSSLLFSGTLTPGAVGTINLLPAGNYVISEIDVILQNLTATAAGAALWLASIPGVSSFAFVQTFVAGALVAPTQILINKRYGDGQMSGGLVIPRTGAINLVTAQRTNITAVNIIINISGFILQ